MTNKVSVGSSAFALGDYSSNPVPLDRLTERLQELNFQGIELLGCRPHGDPDDYPTGSDRKQLKRMFGDHGLEISNYGADFKERSPASNDPDERSDYKKLLKRILSSVWTVKFRTGSKGGVLVVWEFEPGFMFNKPGEIIKMAEEVSHDNFKILFDSCHAHMCSAVAARQEEPLDKLEGGEVELAGLLSGKSGMCI